MAQSTNEEKLSDVQILELSLWITTEGELENLGREGLNLPDDMIELALWYRQNDTNQAARDLLFTWLSPLEDRVKAYRDVKEALRRCGMNFLANELQQWTATDEAEKSKGITIKTS